MEPFLSNLPESPGVYKMKDARWNVLYVGKSVSLKHRVLSYFNGKNRLNAAKRQMVEKIADVETVTTRTATEALILETNLIKALKPKYNVLMKDDKDLAYVRISDGPVRSVERVRARGKTGAHYGPYPAGMRISKTLEDLRRAFRVRSCRMAFESSDGKVSISSKAGRSVPCMDHYIGICPAPCALTEKALSEHDANVSMLEKFLTGDRGNVIDALKLEMAEHAKALRFEEAQKCKERVESLSMLSEKQVARNAVKDDCDAVVAVERGGRTYVGFCRIRQTELRSLERHSAHDPLSEGAEAVELRFLSDFYGENGDDPPKFLLLERPIENETFAAFLTERGIIAEYPRIGTKADLLRFLKSNVSEYALRDGMEKIAARSHTRATMASVLEKLGFGTAPKGPIGFECYDISHTDGHFTVASRVVTTNGKPDTAKYRKYKIKTLADGGIDDFASLREVLYRRTLEGFETGNFPTAFVIDGWKGQLSAAREGVERAVREHGGERNDRTLPFLFSLAKREEEVFTEASSESVRFEKGSPELTLLQNLRDEAHRFAISFNRKTRSKAMKKNVLEELPGFGPVTRKKLLALAGSVEGIRELPPETLKTVLNATQMETLESHGIV